MVLIRGTKNILILLRLELMIQRTSKLHLSPIIKLIICSCFFSFDDFFQEFHPLARPNFRRELNSGDWADSLDRIRLEWNKMVTNPDDSGPPAHN